MFARLFLATFLLLSPLAALAHHGLMIWEEETTTIEGFIAEEMDGFPHWEISVRTPDGETWEVDVGSQFEMDKAGMKAEDLPVGTRVQVEGNRPKGSETLLLRPKRIVAGEKVYEFRGNWN